MQYSVFIATSLDGYIARPDGAIDWLDEAAATAEGQDFGYADFIATINCIVIGRGTLEKVLTFPEWPYQLPIVVLSRSLKAVPKGCQNTSLHHGPLPDLTQHLQSQGYRRVYVDGGKTIQSFLEAGLVSDLTITQIPVLIGSGLPLFGELSGDVKLQLKQSESFSNGFVQSVYEVA